LPAILGGLVIFLGFGPHARNPVHRSVGK
jgi:hypothetical protein